MLGLGLLVAILAIVPLGLATWAFGRAYGASETGRTDARLVAAARLALDQAASATAVAERTATTVARSRPVQLALARQDATAARKLSYRTPRLRVAVTLGPGPPSRVDGISRTVAVTGPNGTLGHVSAVVLLPPLVNSLAARTGVDVAWFTRGLVRAGTLAGWRPSGPVGRPYGVRFHDRDYRVLRGPLAPRVGFVAFVPQRVINATVRHRQLLTLGAALLTLAALGAAAVLLLPRGRSALRLFRSPRGRNPLALVGDVVAAAHDAQALLPVILETAVVATGAVGGHVVWEGARVAAIGSEVGGGRRIALPLDEEEEQAATGRREIVLYPPRGGFSAADREVAASLVAQGRIALENARLHSIVRRQALTDELTDLANRRRFMESLQQEVARAGRFASPLSLVLFDLDHFKQINDRYGHQVGDDVLRATADVIRGRVRETDLPARIGGEEFAVVLAGTDVNGAAALAEHLRHDLSQRVDVHGADWTVTASFGVAMLRAGDTAELLIGAADRALYRAKAAGRNTVCLAKEPPA